MSNPKEVEIKVSLSEDDAEKVENQVFDQNFSHYTESDTYFTAPVRDYMETNECLRIRERDGEPIELTYKGATTEEMDEEGQFWKEEVDIPIEDVEDAKSLLNAVGCEELVTVVKERKHAEIDDKEITLDYVEPVGYFLEIESTAYNQEGVEEAVEDNKSFLTNLGLDEVDVVDQPYRDIAMDAQQN